MILKIAKRVCSYAWNDSFWSAPSRANQFDRNQKHIQNLALADATVAVDILKAKVHELFEVPPELESEPLIFHKGWELCARQIYQALDA